MFRFALTQIARWTARCRRPSSAGKPSSGEIAIGGRKIDSVEPYDRNIGMVFQNYALFPHMNVADNVGFPL
jgi:ABC-type sugar transport system ATPase subunit